MKKKAKMRFLMKIVQKKILFDLWGILDMID